MNFNSRLWIRIFAILILLFLLFHSGVPIYFVGIIGVIIILLVLLRGHLYRKIDHLLKKHFKFMSKIKKPWVEKLIIIVVFIIVYIALRELIYFVLGLFGIDLQNIISEGFNQSAGSSIGK